jgi:anti-anti-sigma factor
MRHIESFRISVLPQHDDFTISTFNGLPVVSTPPEIDIANIHLLSRALMTASADAMVVVVDMSATTFCDCTGLGALVRMYRWLDDNYVELRLVSCTERVQVVMAITNLDRELPIFGSLAEAVTKKPQNWPHHHQAA